MPPEIRLSRRTYPPSPHKKMCDKGLHEPFEGRANPPASFVSKFFLGQQCAGSAVGRRESAYFAQATTKGSRRASLGIEQSSKPPGNSRNTRKKERKTHSEYENSVVARRTRSKGGPSQQHGGGRHTRLKDERAKKLAVLRVQICRATKQKDTRKLRALKGLRDKLHTTTTTTTTTTTRTKNNIGINNNNNNNNNNKNLRGGA